MKNLVSTSWLENNIENVRVLDGTWHMPNVKRNALNEYSNFHIKNSVFLDLDEVSEQNSLLPHMLPKKEYWEERISTIGIKNSDHVVIYDNSDIISSCRCWYNFIYFGHDPSLVSVLNGGLKKWINEKKSTVNDLTKIISSDYIANEKKELVKDKKQIDENINVNKFKVIDARSRERFEGKIPEPRKGLRSGSIKNSFCLPFSELINEDHTFISKEKILDKFKLIKFKIDENIVFTCGSGVTASVLALAYSLIDIKYMPTIYDGSWSEYGKN